jgi:amidase
VIERLNAESFGALATDLGLRPADFDTYDEVLESISTVLDELDPGELAGGVPAPDVKPGGGPSDPFNAIVRRCSIRSARGVGGTLDGMRIVVKDSVAVAGVPLTCGSSALVNYVPADHSVVVRRLVEAGAEIVGVANMDSFAFSGGGDTSDFGPTLNPFDATRTAGGSSGGSAAALYYAGVDGTLGADQGGSIRVPASWCGVLGLKPTHGRVPYTGVVGIDHTFDHVGPLALDTRTLASLFDVIAGPYEGDPRQAGTVTRTAAMRDAVEHAPASLAGVRIGVVQEALADGAVSPEVRAAFDLACSRLAELGAVLTRVSIPGQVQAGAVAFAGFVEGMRALMESGGNGYHWRGEYSPALALAIRDVLRERGHQLSPQVKAVMVLGRWLQRRYGGAVYARAQNIRAELRRSYSDSLTGLDCVVMPTTPGLPHDLGAHLSPAERVLRGWGVLANTSATDMTGHPALSMPAGAAAGLPVGVMLIGQLGADTRLVQIARTYEAAFGWTRPGAPFAQGALAS